MRGASKDDYFKRANDFYTKKRVEKYSSFYNRTGKRYKHISKTISRIIKKSKRKINILDLGCGEGRYFHLFKNTNLILGVDASKEMLASAAKNNKKKKNIKLINTNILKFVPKERFDLVLSIGVLCEHIPLTQEVLNNIYNSLNDGSYFFFTTSVPAGIKHKSRRLAGDVALFMLKPFIGKGKVYRKLLKSYTNPKNVKKKIEKTNFSIIQSKRVNNKGSSIDQHFWLLKK